MIVKINQFLHAEDKCAVVSFDVSNYSRVPCVGEFIEMADLNEYQVIRVVHNPHYENGEAPDAEIWLPDEFAKEGRTFDQQFEPEKWEESNFCFEYPDCRDGEHELRFIEIPNPGFAYLQDLRIPLPKGKNSIVDELVKKYGNENN